MPPSPEKLTIEGFAGIEELDLEVRPFTVLIGPQSVGKSVVAKLLYFFRSSPQTLLLAAMNAGEESATETLLDRFAKLLPSPTGAEAPARISYSMGQLEFVLQHAGSSPDSWELKIPFPLFRAFKQFRDALQEEDGQEGMFEANEMAKEAFHERFRSLWPEAVVRPRFVPAGRSFFSQIERDMASYFDSATLDPFVAEFGKFLAVLKGRLRIRRPPPTSEIVVAIVEQLLNGRYAREGNEEFIRSPDGRALPPRLWSSGQQEVQPLALLLERYCDGFFSPTCLFIEEPEAHLFPSSQRLITELIALAFNARQPGMQMFVTTHSPYILTTINNLLLAGQLYAQKLNSRNRASLAELASKECALPEGQIGAFYMDRTGCRSILDPETKLIGSSAIDEVSGSLNKQFDALLEIEHS